MRSRNIRQKFLEFFQARGHIIRPSSSLIPDDPSVLLTTAGMQQFKLYFTGELNAQEDFLLPSGEPAKGVVTVQKCFRTSDIDEVGDKSHLTFFEMLGNFSFGGYWKKEAIEYAHEFITKELGLEIDYVSIFSTKGGSASGGEGDPSTSSGQAIPEDLESEKIWQSLGVEDIRKCGREDNFWGPTGSEGPCGPTTEIYVNGVEIWNIVFNEYFQDSDGHLEPLIQKGVDTGMGLERLVMAVQNTKNVFETDLLSPIINFLNKEFYKNRPEWSKRIIADHARGIAFLTADGVMPSNKGAGYVLRRLMQRSISHLIEFQFEEVSPGGRVPTLHIVDALELPVKYIIEQYGQYEPYQYLSNGKNKILEVVRQESERYIPIMHKGEKIFRKLKEEAVENKSWVIPGEDICELVTTHGMPLEWIKDLARIHGVKLKLDLIGFDNAFKAHQKISRAGAEKKFGGHGLILNTSELKAGSEEEMKKVICLHTATHLLHRALREVLGSEVGQAGSDITPERTRFDFTFSRKLTPDEIKKAEDLVNQKIKENLPVNFVELPKSEAEKTGALHFFSAKGGSSSGGKQKYPDRVKVYFVGETLESAWSKEFCGGPHVTHTSEIGVFKISKEEAVGSGVRRIRAILNP